jgi:phosphoribosylformylglycinamidine synthase
VAASGARPIAATNCLNFGSPEKPEVMWQFSQAIDGITEACTALGTPITGGNVSFYNETLGKSIYPTPVIGVLGILDDASRVLKIAFRNPGDVILLLDGSALEDPSSPSAASGRSEESRVSAEAKEFSSSEYCKTVAGIVAGEPPAIDLAAEKRLIDCLVALAAEGAVTSVHDISDGGLATATAESCFAFLVTGSFPLGATINIPESGHAESELFSERGARCIVSLPPEKVAAQQTIARQYGVAADEIGQVTGDGSLRIQYKGRAVVDSPIEELRDVWANSLERTLLTK